MPNICPTCGNSFEIGFDDKCDTCQGIKRDANGYAWLPTDFVHVYEVIETGEVIIVTREEAFKNA